MSAQRKNILVVGSLNMDIVIGLPHLPKPGETIIGCDRQEHAGGKGANQAYAAAMLGGSTCMIGRVGRDQYGEALISSLKSAGADTAGVKAHEGAGTGLAFIYVDEKGENTIVVVSGANALLSPTDIRANERLIDGADVVLLQLEIPHETVTAAVEIAKRKGKTVVLNPAPVRQGLESLYGMIDILTPNEGELSELTGEDADTVEQAANAAVKLIDKGVGAVIVTLGGEGALLVTKQGAKSFPARNVDAIDTTAAGDTFSAAVCVALAEGKSLEDAVVFANKAAGIAVTRKGAQPSIPCRSEVDAL